MKDLTCIGPNQWSFTYQGVEWVMLVRPHVVYNPKSELVEVWLPISIYDGPIQPGDLPIVVFHVTPGGQVIPHDEGDIMSGGPLCAIYEEDIEEMFP